MRTAQDIILKPVITEDSMDRLQANRYTFKVAKDANKIEIAKAVEELFNVKVAKVNTISVKGKQKRMGRSVGYMNTEKSSERSCEAARTAHHFTAGRKYGRALGVKTL